MYRKCKNITISNYFADKIELNPCFVINGNEKYLKEAIEKYQKYRIEKSENSRAFSNAR